MRGVRRITHQHDGHLLAAHRFSVNPVAANHARKLNPDRAAAQMRSVAHQRVAI
jgi:hypothetical protein